MLRTDLDWNKDVEAISAAADGISNVPSSGLSHVSLLQTVLRAKWSLHWAGKTPMLGQNLFFPEETFPGGVGDLISRTR